MSSTAKKARRLRNRVIDYVLYIATAFALVFFTMFVSSKWNHEVFIRWGGFGFLTFCLFGFFVQESRKSFAFGASGKLLRLYSRFIC